MRFEMKKLLAIGLIVITSLGFLTKSFILIEYYAFQKSYIEKYCENKDKPELDCKGKCHLSKTMSEEMPSDSSSLPRPKLVEDYELSQCVIESIFTLEGIQVSFLLGETDCTKNIFNGYRSKIKHPPQFS